MQFWDEVEVRFRAGKGGEGVVSFRREKYVPKGGPDGGDGGRGGSIVLVADPSENTLLAFARQKEFRAEAGGKGRGKNCAGADAPDLVLRVPVGTLVRDLKRGHVLKDLSRPGARVVIAKGGRGGRGNGRFATSVRRTPRIAEGGRPGEIRRTKLELKLVAEVGLVGLPNSGKSTLLARVSAARPKIAPYPFTTLVPELGVVSLSAERSFVMVEIPGLIEGAHRGAGLGDAFLRHIERTRVLLHLVDCSSLAAMAPRAAHETVMEELGRHSAALLAKPRLVVATKLDDPAAARNAEALERALGAPVLRISAVTGLGLGSLLAAVSKTLGRSARRGRLPSADLKRFPSVSR